MAADFFDAPILNSPYHRPDRHWQLDADGQPTNVIVEDRRLSKHISPVPKPKRRQAKAATQTEFVYGDAEGLTSAEQEYTTSGFINSIRGEVEAWRALRNPKDWNVTPETQRLLRHWRHHSFEGIRPFFCQIEAVETAIWLTEVAPKLGARTARLRRQLENANEAANPELLRVALKLATGAGKTTVMAMLIAWMTINAVRHAGRKNFARSFLIVTPGITIRDRLRVLKPNDPDSYYAARELVPTDMLGELHKARIAIVNYHAFKPRERLGVAKGTRALLEGRDGTLATTESEGEVVRRVMGDLMGLGPAVVLNDEAHHCYRENPAAKEEKLTQDDKVEAKRNNEAARLWISGLEAVKRTVGVKSVYDLSATPFFLRGSGYAEGTLFPWTVSDFSLMDAIECGIVKLPRVPVADNDPDGDTPKFRNLWETIRNKMPRMGRAKAGIGLDIYDLPAALITALDALYGHYDKTARLWEEAGIEVPPVFIIVCNNTATSKLIYDFVSGYWRHDDDGETTPIPGRLERFKNYDEYGSRYALPRTVLIDSEQLESGDALDPKFRSLAADEIERFRRERVQRTNDQNAGANITDQDLLREVMNTVGKPGRLGEGVRCVVSVSMLTEGWDANTVTHILGVRAFGTQLLCEQVVGRGLRRRSYDLKDDGRFEVEYADVLGIPFDFTGKPVVSAPQKPKKMTRVHAMTPERDHLEIRFPRIEGYRLALPDNKLEAQFDEHSTLILSPERLGPTVTKNRGIVGAEANLSLNHLAKKRRSTVIFELAKNLIFRTFRDGDDQAEVYRFGELKRICKRWIDQGHLACVGGAYQAQVLYPEILDEACELIAAAIKPADGGERRIHAVLDSYNPTGSTVYVGFATSKEDLWDTAGPPAKCHLNRLVLDSAWEAEFCRVVEAHPRVLAYVKNHNLGLEVPYRVGSDARRYIPDFVVRIDDGHGPDDPLSLVVEISGYPQGNKAEKKAAMRGYWVPAVNALGRYGRWDFAEFDRVYEMEADFADVVEQRFDKLVEQMLVLPRNVAYEGRQFM